MDAVQDGTPDPDRFDLPPDGAAAAAEIARLRRALADIYTTAGRQLWKSRRRPDTAGHHCDYRAGLHAVKDRAKAALSVPPRRPQAT